MNVLQSIYHLLVHGCVIRACITLILTGVLCFLLRLVYKKFSRRFKQTTHFASSALLQALYKPLILFVAVMGTTYAFEWLCWHWQLEAQQFQLFRDFIFIAFVAWFLWGFVVLYSEGYLKRDITKAVDTTLVHALTQISKIAIILFSALSLFQLLGLSLAGVLAFGGMGGILIGFAAKDLLANIFGSLMLFLDRPFVIGDKIRLPALKVEGQVQTIGWRVCRLLTPDCRPVYVPNALFSNLVVENKSRMKHRCFSCTVSLRYDDLAKIPAILQAMQSVLNTTTEIDKDRSITVNLDELAQSSLNIAVTAYTPVVNNVEFLELQQTLYFKLLDCIQRNDAKWAFPSSICFNTQE